MKFTIQGELPDANQVIAASKSHYIVYSRMKAENTLLVRLEASKLTKVDKADFEITWYCKNKRKDKDNIMFGQKFIFDGLVDAKIIENDGWSQIGDVVHKFKVDKDNPRIEIIMKEVKE